MNQAPQIKCDGFILRLPKESDIYDRMNLGRSAEFVRMCGGSTLNIQPFTENELKGWYDWVINSPCEWVIEQNGHCVGIARLVINNGDNKATYSIGIFDEKLFGEGPGTKVTKAVLKYAFETLQLHRVDLRVLEYNTRGIRCYEKCGFVKEGVEREGAFIEGKYYSDIMMSILDFEYKKQYIEKP